jgi:hypothetical protein
MVAPRRNAVPSGAAMCDWLLFGGGERIVLPPAAAAGPRRHDAGGVPEPLPSRWVVLAAAVIAECAGCGIGYSFGIYSPLLKSQFHISQTQLATVNTASMVVSIPPFCFFFAWIYDRFGPNVSQKLGAACLALGYGTTCMMLRGMLGEFSPGAAVLVLALCTILTNLGSCLVGIGGVASTIKSFPVSQRGVVTGLVKTGNGISAGIYTQIYLGFIAPDIFGFLFMCFVVSSCTVFVASHFLGVDTTALRHVRDTRGKKTDRQHVASCYSTRCTMLSFCFQDKLRTARVVVRTSVLFSLFWIACWQEEKVRKTPLLSHFYTTNDHFTKTGSRQTL